MPRQELTVRRTLKLDEHASSRGSLLIVGAGGAVGPADPATLSLSASSASVSGSITADKLTCRGAAEVGGKVSIAGGVAVRGELELGGGMDAQGTRIANAYLENANFRGAVQGDVEFGGDVKIGALKKAGGGFLVTADASGQLGLAAGVGYDMGEGIFVAGRVSGHEVSQQ